MDETKKVVKDWRKLEVLRNRKFEHLVEKLVSKKPDAADRPLFLYNKDLMVFAAMLGYNEGRKGNVGKDPIKIDLETYASDEKDGYIYLLALLETQDTTILKDDRLKDAIKIFEHYCNGGLELLDIWYNENPQDLDGVETLLNAMIEQFEDYLTDPSLADAVPSF